MIENHPKEDNVKFYEGCYFDRTAIFDDIPKSVGINVKVWAYSHIGSGVSIGDNVTIGEGVHIGKNVTIGNNCRIQNHAILYEGLEIGNNVFIGPGVITTNDIFPTIERADQFREDGRFMKTYLKDGCSIGANSTLLCGISIGENTIIGCGSNVLTSFGEGLIVGGNPAKILRHRDAYEIEKLRW